MKKSIAIVLIIILVCSLCGGFLFYWFNIREADGSLLGTAKGNRELIDDWKYEGANSQAVYSTASKSNMMDLEGATSVQDSSYLGLSTGGAKNIANFRENIRNGYFPISTDITYNGLFYDYYFDTGRQGDKPEELFSPTYSTACSKDPISGEYEYYMTVGLNSNIKESDFARKKLNLVVVVDISGSMGSTFNSYYYDGINVSKEEKLKSKMKIANESVNLLIDKLKDGDRFGMVLFDDSAYLAKPMNLVEETDLDQIKEHVLEIEPEGGTNFSAGYTEATELFNEKMLNDKDYENRIIFITDAMPNLGKTSKDELAVDVRKNAEKGLYTSFIGVGVDFNTEVIECLSNVKGANYYSIHNSEEFKKIMGEDFEYMVTPVAFDIKLNFESDRFKIEKVYGTDCKDETSNTIMKVNTLFPASSNSNGESKGGIILLKLKCSDGCITENDVNEKFYTEAKNKITVSYTDRNGKQHSNSQEVQLRSPKEEYYDNTGIRKGIVLTRYTNLMKDWILYERSERKPMYLVKYETGIIDNDYSADEVRIILGENERTSTKLTVSDSYKELFRKFREYMGAEISAIGDDSMKQEVDILDILIS